MANQDVKFKIINEVTGMEQMAALINRMGALEAQMASVIKANAGLAASNDAVVRNGTRYNNALDAQSKAVRNARMGTQQLGMQFNDFATSVSTGASPIQAFNQQLGQAGYAMSMMGGTAGRIGAFLAGPWGAAITLATMAIGFLWDSMNESDKVSKTFESSMKRAQDALFSYRIETAKTREELLNLYETKLAGVELEWKKASAAVGIYGGNLRRANEALDEWATRPLYKVVGDFFDSREAKASLDEQRENANNLYADMMGMQTSLAQLRKRFASEDQAASDKASKAADRLAAKMRKEAEALRKELGITADPVSESEGKISTLRRMFDAGSVSVDEYRRAISGLRADLNKATGKPTPMIDMAPIAGPLDISEQVKNLTDSLPSIRGFTEEVQNAFEAVGMSVNDAFKGMLTAGMSWKDGMKGIIQSVIDELWRVFVVQQIVGMVSNAVGGMFKAPVQAGGSSAFNAAFAEFAPKAIGGSVGANTPYIVGERGPELFVPRGNGTIIPNKNMGGGSASTINVSVDARGASDPAAVRAQVQQGILEAAPAIVAAAEKRTIDSLRRPRLGGAMQ